MIAPPAADALTTLIIAQFKICCAIHRSKSTVLVIINIIFVNFLYAIRYLDDRKMLPTMPCPPHFANLLRTAVTKLRIFIHRIHMLLAAWIQT